MVLPATDWPSPDGQVDQGVQGSIAVVLAPGLNVPEAHAAHSRSLVTVAAALVYVPAPHAAETDAQASPESASEYVVPSPHAAHVRSDEADGAAVCPWPAGHVDHAVHVRSLVAVAAALS